MSFLILSLLIIGIIYYRNQGTKSFFEDDILIPVGSIYTEKPKEVRIVEKPVVVEKPVYIYRQAKPTPKPIRQENPKPVRQENPIFSDAVLALVKLGYKKKDASIISSRLIGEGIKDLNELILKAFKR